MEFSNKIRYYYYISGIFAKQKSDPLCSICKAFSNSVRAAREGLDELERKHIAEIKALPSEMRPLFSEAKKSLAELTLPENAVGQKKAGNCKMPEGTCFIKSSKALLDKIQKTGLSEKTTSCS